MPRSKRIILPFLFSLIIICLTSVRSGATTAVPLTDRELTVSARFIVTGVVRSVTVAWDDAKENVWTYVEVDCDRVLKGRLSSRKIVLKQLGGDVGDGGLQIFGRPTFQQGQRVLLYLSSAYDGTLHVAHSFL